MILQRYLIKEVFTTTVVVLSFLILMLLGSRIIKLFGRVANGGLDATFLLPLVVYKLASVLVLLLPLSFFIGLMLVFGRLYVDQEITVLQGSGVSPRQIALKLWPLVLVLVLVQIFLSFFAADWGERKSEQVMTEQALKGAFDLVRPQEFIRSGDYSLYVGGLDKKNRELVNIMLVQKNGAKSELGKPRDVIILAQRAAQAGTVTKPTLVLSQPDIKSEQLPKPAVEKTTMLDLYNGRRYELGTGQLSYNEIGFSKYRLSFSQTDEANQDELDLPAQSTWHLLNSLPDTAAQAELGFRLGMPLVLLLAWVLSVPLSRAKPRQGRWVRLLPSILFYATSVVVLISLKSSVAAGKVSVFANLGVVLVYLAVAVFAYNQGALKRRRKAKMR